jgi:hypothetical protein
LTEGLFRKKRWGETLAPPGFNLQQDIESSGLARRADRLSDLADFDQSLRLKKGLESA